MHQKKDGELVLKVDSFTQGSQGSVSQSGTELTYSPNLGVWSGTDSFDYTSALRWMNSVPSGRW